MDNALRLLIKEGDVLSELSSRERETSSLVRDAFANSICTHSVKCTLEIEYFSLADSSAMKEGVTAALKYAENRMRGIMGVKSRLAVKGMPDKYKSILEPYFNALEGRERAASHREDIPEYEKLYSAPAGNLSASGADEIERASWSTTMRLVEYDDDAPQIAVTEPEIIEEAPIATPASTESPLSDSDVEFLRRAYAYTYDDGAGSDDHTTAEGINERALDLIGDVALEYDGEFYRIIEDYKEDIEEWIK
jgi:hypothetical protein